MDKSPTIHWTCNYLSILGLKLTHLIKGDQCRNVEGGLPDSCRELWPEVLVPTYIPTPGQTCICHKYSVIYMLSTWNRGSLHLASGISVTPLYSGRKLSNHLMFALASSPTLTTPDFNVCMWVSELLALSRATDSASGTQTHAPA